MTNRWIEHVKAYALQHKVSYPVALKMASKTYQGKGIKEGATKLALRIPFVRKWLVTKIAPLLVDLIGDTTGGFGFIQNQVEKYTVPPMKAYLEKQLVPYFPDPQERAYIVSHISRSMKDFIQKDMEFQDAIMAFQIKQNLKKYEKTGVKTKDPKIRSRLTEIFKKYLLISLEDPKVQEILGNNISHFPI